MSDKRTKLDEPLVEDDETVLEEPFLKRPSMILWITVVGLLVLSIAFPVIGWLTPVVPFALVIVLILYWMALGVVSMAWGLFLSALVFLLSSPMLLYTGLRKEFQAQRTQQ